MSQQVLPGLVVNRHVPTHSVYSSFIHLFQHELSRELPSISVTSLDNTIFVRDTLFSRTSRQFLTTFTHLPNHQPSSLSLIKRLLLLPLSRDTSDNSYLIASNNWSSGYFHWLLDTLPRIYLYQSHVSADFVLILPSSYSKFTYITSTLSLLDVKTLYVTPFQPLRLRRLHTISPIANSGVFRPLLLKKLRDTLLSTISYSDPTIATDILFISRKKASRRHLLNEKECIDYLSKEYSVRTISLEDYSLIEQIHIVRSSKVLVGLHGSGLANCLFLNQEQSLLEIRFVGDDRNNCFFALASALNIKYGFVFATKCNSLSTQDSDAHVDDLFALSSEVARLIMS